MKSKQAENIRGVIRYVQQFKNALIVIYIDEKTIDSSLFSSHINDIALLHKAGLQVIIIPGARNRIDEILTTSKIKWTYKNNVRITSSEAMPLIKMAAFDVSNTVMTSLAANGITAVIGNWVRSRAKGIIDGFDYGTAGEIDKLEVSSIKTVLSDGFIPIFPCIGWNSIGRPYNISTVSLAQQIAINLQADKLFFYVSSPTLNSSLYNIPQNFPLTKNGNIPAMDLTQVDLFLKENPSSTGTIPALLSSAKEACQNGVTRVHIVDGNVDGVILSEIFSDLGSGTMIYTSDYGTIRSMQQNDIPSVISIQKPFVDSGKLLPRTENQIEESINDYIVYELDGGIRACASLHVYQDNQAEIAAVAVDDSFAHMGIGPKMISFLINKAHQNKINNIFILTTQASDWFEKLGFELDNLNSLPQERLALWSQDRNSKVYRLRKN
ncbi:MAG: amino-acid N-acetyltransferase [Treponema sp.]|jgi:amino-acid N-acetyltransferase|nr:amino-acid N-acetyltransferase [Treponema sp.]